MLRKYGIENVGRRGKRLSCRVERQFTCKYIYSSAYNIPYTVFTIHIIYGMFYLERGILGEKAMTNFDNYLAKQMKNEDFRQEYNALTPQYEIISQIIKERAEQHLTQKELAERIGIRQSHISRLESGNYNPSLEFLQKVASGLGKELHIEFRQPKSLSK